MTATAAAAQFDKKLKKIHNRVPTQGYNYEIKHKRKKKYLSMG